ncbi:AAA family ATPase [Blastococcus sp. TML/M2B]|nr:AAA family ATPase [Blastococcus sp. TML/M2B]
MPHRDDAPMVGRAAELARLLATLDRAATGRSGAVLLSGDAGVGKTRLLDELTARAEQRGFRVLTGHCVDLGDVGLPYLPFVDLLRPVAADPEPAPVAATSAVLAPLFAGRPVAAPPPAVPEARDLGRELPHRAAPPPVDDGRLQLFEAVAALVCELAGQEPLLLVLEDVHWADRSSRDLLRYLLARFSDERVAVVASYRADDLHRRHPLRPLLAELVRLPAVERLELGPLPDDDVGALVRRLAADAGVLPDSVVDDVVTRAEGNAFYAEELLAAGLHGEVLPLGLTDVLLARVEQRSPATQQVVRVAAVAGRRVRHELVAAVSGLADGDLEAALAEAVHHYLLVVSDDGRYRFRHALPPRGGAGRPAAGGAGAAARGDRRLPGPRPGRRHRGRARPPRAGEQRPAGRVRGVPGGGGRGARCRRPRRAAAAPGGGAGAVVGGAGRRGAGGPRPGGAAAGDGGERAHRGGVPPRRRPAAGRAAGAGSRRRPRRPGADPLHAGPGDGPGRGRRGGLPRERRGDGAGARAAAVGGAHLGGCDARADELLRRPAGRGGRHGGGGPGGRGRAGLRRSVGRHRGHPGAGAARCRPRRGAGAAGRGAGAGGPVRRRRGRDAGAVQPGDGHLRGRVHRRGAGVDAAGHPAGP